MCEIIKKPVIILDYYQVKEDNVEALFQLQEMIREVHLFLKAVVPL